MLYCSISRLFLWFFLTAQLPLCTLIAQPKSSDGRFAITMSKIQSGENSSKIMPQDTKKQEENTELWRNPFVQIGFFVAFLYAGGALVAASIYYQIKDILPVDKSQ